MQEKPQQKPSEEELTRRSKRSRGRGRGFETYVVNHLKKMGYTRAKKIELSGMTRKKPYDVKVPPLRLKLECKRRMGESLPLDGKWLNRISPNFAIVFAVGPRIAPNGARLYAISLADKDANYPEVQMNKCKTIYVNVNEFTIPRLGLADVVVQDRFIIVYNDRKFLVQDFDEYMKFNWEVKNGVSDGESV